MIQHPWEFNPDLTEDRIMELATLISQVRGEVIDKHDIVLGDTPLSLGLRAYECCRSRIIRAAESEQWPWLSILTPEGRFTFCINETPVRFVRNEPKELPDKKLIVSEEADIQMSLLNDTEYSNTRWFFVFDTYYKNPADRVYFVGYDESGYIQCQWAVPLDEKVSFLSSVDSYKTKAVELPAAPVQIKQKIGIKKISNE